MIRVARGLVTIMVFLSLWGDATAVLFNFTAALSPWLESWTDTPSAQANSNLRLLRSSQNSTATLGTILFNSISQNQSYAVAEPVRFALLPSRDFDAADPVVAPAYQALSANIGAATAYAMHYASQQAGGLPGGLASAEVAAPPPTAGGPMMRGGPDPPAAVQPSASDIFYAVAAGALGAVASSCDAMWTCHTSGCLSTPDTPVTLLQKRADTCCYLVGPLLRGIERQLTLFGEEALLGSALSPNVTVQDPFNLGFLDRCIWYKDEVDIRNNAPPGCNANTTNYMGNVVQVDVNSHTPGAPVVATAADCCAACVADMQCNVWVFCGKAWGCEGCNWQAINYKASVAADPTQRFGPYGPGCSQPDGLFPLGTCTLKSATFKEVPPAYANPAASDFVSGYLTKHNVPRQ